MGVLLLAIFLPLAAGALLPLLRRLPRRAQLAYVTAVLAAEAVLTVALACMDEVSVTLLRITPELVVAFRTDGVARVFSLIGALLWLPVGVYSFKYLTHEANENRFLSFYLLVLGALLGMDYASNLVSMYFFYELVTLTALPLVLHSGTKESIHAALKYLFYSIAGAFLALLGIFCVSRFTTLDFVPGGTLAGAVPESYLPLVRALVFCAVLGFGAKAGLYPLHGWLPAAHPVAPGPASAVLSAVIAKSGVLGILRFIYFVVGPDFLRGTWVQIAWLALGMATILMGSMMAWREKLFKRRLAYSTVSQISYILCGLFLLTEAGVQGALLHTVFHAVAKTGLFLTAGAVDLLHRQNPRRRAARRGPPAAPDHERLYAGGAVADRHPATGGLRLQVVSGHGLAGHGSGGRQLAVSGGAADFGAADGGLSAAHHAGRLFPGTGRPRAGADAGVPADDGPAAGAGRGVAAAGPGRRMAGPGAGGHRRRPGVRRCV